MMRRPAMWGTLLASAALLLVSGAVTGFAQDKLAEIKTRQDFMKAQGADMKAVIDFTKGNADQQKALNAVNDLIARAPKIDDMFPAGTSAADFPGKTKAKPELWTDWDKAKMIPAAVGSQEEKLKAAIEAGNKAQVASQAGALAKNGCGSCHSHYRLPET